jgi:hypothetical protein
MGLLILHVERAAVEAPSGCSEVSGWSIGAACRRCLKQLLRSPIAAVATAARAYKYTTLTSLAL